MACRFIDILIKCCFECKVYDICPKQCSGFSSNHKDCNFYDDSIDALCVYESSVRKGEELDIN